jgi:hypothetical protein
MGMFDSLMVKINDREIEIQTKRFENRLGRYHPGDAVCGAPGGIGIYFDTVELDADGRHAYQDDKITARHTVFVVLVHGIFTEYEVMDGAWEREAIERRVCELKDLWGDTARVTLRWIEFLRNAQDEKARLRGCINRSLSVIDHARRLQAGEDMSGKFSALFKSEEDKRLDAGEEVLDVLESVLKKPEASRFWWCSQQERDALEDYRL